MTARVADVCDQVALRDVVAETEKRYGGIDVAVGAVGVTGSVLHVDGGFTA